MAATFSSTHDQMVLISALERYPIETPTPKQLCLMHAKLSEATNNTILYRTTGSDFIWGAPGKFRNEKQPQSVNGRGTNPTNISGEMEKLAIQLNDPEWKGGDSIPSDRAAFLIARLHSISPFGDGNGRVSWLAAGSMMVAGGHAKHIPVAPPAAEFNAAVKVAVDENDLGPLSGLIVRSINPLHRRPEEVVPSLYPTKSRDDSAPVSLPPPSYEKATEGLQLFPAGDPRLPYI